MVLAELGSRLTTALRKARPACARPPRVRSDSRALARCPQMSQSAVVDEAALDACLKEVTKALLEVRPVAWRA